MKLLLAPMEGVVDSVMRDLLTRIGGFTHCATEFVRITSQLLPPSVYYRYCPELRRGGATGSGVPVFVQLLGGQPDPMAENAARAVELGALGIDLNFGCPAKTVNRHDGGAVILKNPERVYDIVATVRRAVPKEIPVTAKVRLGYETPRFAVEIAQAAEAAGAEWLSVHARTKIDGYRPPAHWDWLARIRQSVSLEVIANGDIWNVEDYLRCVEVSGCESIMLGRGVIARPDLALQIQRDTVPLSWEQILPWLRFFVEQSEEKESEHFALCRIKQWTRLLGRNYPESMTLFERIKRESTKGTVYNWLLMDYQGAKEKSNVHYSSASHFG